jgi:hypothetical protein
MKSPPKKEAGFGPPGAVTPWKKKKFLFRQWKQITFEGLNWNNLRTNGFLDFVHRPEI